MKAIIQAKVQHLLMNYFLRLCGDLFPKGIAFQFTSDEPSIVRANSNGEAIESTPDPTAIVCLELPREIIRLATLKNKASRPISSQNASKLNVYMSRCGEEMRCEVEAAWRIAAADIPFSVELMEVVKYLPPNAKQR